MVRRQIRYRGYTVVASCQCAETDQGSVYRRFSEDVRRPECNARGCVLHAANAGYPLADSHRSGKPSHYQYDFVLASPCSPGTVRECLERLRTEMSTEEHEEGVVPPYSDRRMKEIAESYPH